MPSSLVYFRGTIIFGIPATPGFNTNRGSWTACAAAEPPGFTPKIFPHRATILSNASAITTSSPGWNIYHHGQVPTASRAEKEKVDDVQEGRGCSVAEGGGRNWEEKSGL